MPPDGDEQQRHSAPAPAVRAESLTVQRGGVEVLHGLSFTVPAGRVTGLLGPSGCGKSTLMRTLVGVQARVDGEVQVLGARAGSAQLRREVAFMTQSPSVYADISVLENLRYFAALLGVDRVQAQQSIETVELSGEAHRRVDTLSGGQRARVSLACALLGGPRLLVLDEPTVGLDPVLRVRLWELFRRLADEGATLLVSSHVMDEARHCDELILMRSGEILAQQTPRELAQRAGTEDLEQAFLRIVEPAQGARR